MFGQYLIKIGLVGKDDVYRARMLQRKFHLGALALKKGWLTQDHIDRILVYQEESRKTFGDIAVKEDYLTRGQVDELLEIQKKDYLFIGEALVKIGAMSAEALEFHLKEFAGSDFQKFRDNLLK